MHIRPQHATDFYKTGHIFQYTEGTELVYANFTPRSDRLAQVLPEYFDGKVVFFGLQGFIQWFLVDLWNKEFFQRPKEEVVQEYKRRVDNAVGAGVVAVDHVAALWDLGYLPIEIKALPEGSRVNIKVPVFTVKNTVPEFFWLTNYIETVASTESWKAITNATIAFEYRKILLDFQKRTGANKDFVQWQGHDFSMRGMSGVHDAASAGAGHLLSFWGTDTIPAIDYLEDYYFADSDKEIVGGSVPATEHSVMCMGGTEGEIETFRRLIQDVYPKGIVSIVSDTWDFWKVITQYAKELQSVIYRRQPDALGNAKVVFRPDSGDPVKILTGYRKARFLNDPKAEVYQVNGKWYKVEAFMDEQEVAVCPDNEVSEAEVKGAVECLWEIFGGSTNDKGFKTLSQCVGLIYGDSITLERCKQILERLEAKGFASDNVVFGIGSYTYQYNTRDTFGFAVKATAGIVNGEFRELFKDPITDSGAKKSAKGLLRVEKEGEDFVLYDQQSWEQEEQGVFKTVFKDGKPYNQQTLGDIRSTLLQN